MEKKFSKLQKETVYVAAVTQACECSAVFLRLSGKELKLAVPRETLEALKPGRKGMLSWQGSAFISFEAEG